MASERNSLIVRLRRAYAFLRYDGRFVTADTVLCALHEVQALHNGIAAAIRLCEQDAADQDHNATLKGWGRCSKAYAEGRGTACKGIATRLRALLPETP